MNIGKSFLFFLCGFAPCLFLAWVFLDRKPLGPDARRDYSEASRPMEDKLPIRVDEGNQDFRIDVFKYSNINWHQLCVKFDILSSHEKTRPLEVLLSNIPGKGQYWEAAKAWIYSADVQLIASLDRNASGGADMETQDGTGAFMLGFGQPQGPKRFPVAGIAYADARFAHGKFTRKCLDAPLDILGQTVVGKKPLSAPAKSLAYSFAFAQDFDAAASFFRKEEDAEREEITGSISFAISFADYNKAVSLALEVRSANLLESALQRAANIDPAFFQKTLVAVLHHDWLPPDVLENSFRKLPLSELLKIQNGLAGLDEGRHSLITGALIPACAALDPSAAGQMVGEMDDGPIKDEAIVRTFGLLVLSRPSEAFDFLINYVPFFNSYQSSGQIPFAASAKRWAMLDPQGIEEFAKNCTNPVIKGILDEVVISAKHR